MSAGPWSDQNSQRADGGNRMASTSSPSSGNKIGMPQRPLASIQSKDRSNGRFTTDRTAVQSRNVAVQRARLETEPHSSASGSPRLAATCHRAAGASSPPQRQANGVERSADGTSQHVSETGELRVGVLPLVPGALDVGDDGRVVVWLDIDNTLYRKSTRIAELMTERIRAYFLSLGLSEEEAHRLHQRYYKEYGLAIRGLVMHHEIDALDYDAKCDATLPLDDILQPDPSIKAILEDLDRSKCRVWALTNAYKTHAIRVLRLLELDKSIEGVIFCDYAKERFACKPEPEFYSGAMAAIGMLDPQRCYFVDDSLLNIRAAKKMGWRSCVFFDEADPEPDPKDPCTTDQGSPDGPSRFDANATTHENDQLLLAISDTPFDEEKVKKQFRSLSAPVRLRLLHSILEACMPGDLVAMKSTIDKHLSLTRDIISGLPDEIHVRIFERLHIHELLRCRRVSKRWNAISANPDLWRSHTLALTSDDPTPLAAPAEPAGWEPLVKGLYFRERNWARGICQSVTMMPGHTGFVTAMKLKGRTTLVTGSYDETIRVWDLSSGACKKVLKAKAIACLDFLAQEGILAAGLYDTGRVMLWDMRSWKLLQTLSGHNRGIRNVALNSDYLVSVGQDKAIVVWDWRNGTKIVRFGQQSNVSLGVSIVDHDKIVAVTVDGIIRTFDLSSPNKEMIGQFDVAKLAPGLSARLSGLKDGTNMMQWFAAHRNTITMGSHNLVIHLQWQEHVVSQRTTSDRRTRRDSTASNASSHNSSSRRSSIVPGYATPGVARRSMNTVTPSTPLTPARSPSFHSRRPGSGRPSAGPTGAPFSPQGVHGRTPSSKGTTIRHTRTSSRLSSASSQPETPLASPTSSIAPGKDNDGLWQDGDDSRRSTRIAPNLSVAPLVLSVIDTPEGAVGCVDAAKRRIVCASRFSSRAGANRRLYTTTFDEGRPATGAATIAQRKSEASSSRSATPTTKAPPTEVPHFDVSPLRESVVPIGGAWQAMADHLAIPARNPMSLVLDPDHCVVGTSEGLVYCMGFVGAEYATGWVEAEREHEVDEEDGKLPIQARHLDEKDEGGNAVIADLTELRRVWSSLFRNVN